MSGYKDGEVVPLELVQWNRRRFCQGLVSSAAGAALVQLGGCGGEGQALPFFEGPGDLTHLPDGFGGDLRRPMDLQGDPDLAQNPDLAQPRDLAQNPDLAQSPDLAQPRDLAQNPDLAQPRDLAQSPDLTPPQDLAQLCPGFTSTGQLPGQFALNTATYFVVGTTFVCRDGGGMFAVTAVCTHSGCIINSVNGGAGGYSCPCHFSAFTLNGVVTQGPAGLPLVHFALCKDGNGQIAYNPNSVVAANLRYPF